MLFNQVGLLKIQEPLAFLLHFIVVAVPYNEWQILKKLLTGPHSTLFNAALQHLFILLFNYEGEVIPKLTEEFERTLIEVALTDTAGRKKEAAEKLGWGRNTLTRKLKELGFTDSDPSDD